MPVARLSQTYTYKGKTYGPGEVDVPQEVLDAIREHRQAGRADLDITPAPTTEKRRAEDKPKDGA